MRPEVGPLVLGIGNVLMGDEGVGVHVVQALERSALPPGVAVLDGGTGGFHLLSFLTEHARVILVDATADGQPAGTVAVLEPRYASDFPRALTAHDIGLRDLIEAAALVGALPRTWLVTISIQMPQALGTTLSAPVAKAVGVAAGVVSQLLEEMQPRAPADGPIAPRPSVEVGAWAPPPAIERSA